MYKLWDIIQKDTKNTPNLARDAYDADEDLNDETYHDAFKLFSVKNLSETTLLDEMKHITQLRQNLQEEDVQSYSFEFCF